MSDTGNGTTFAFGTTGAIGDVVSITPDAMTLEMLEDSHLGTTTQKTKVGSDLLDPGGVTVTAWFDSTVALPVPTATAETATTTFAISTSPNTTKATDIGTGCIDSVTQPEVVNGALQLLTVHFTYDGKTEKAYTVESA